MGTIQIKKIARKVTIGKIGQEQSNRLKLLKPKMLR